LDANVSKTSSVHAFRGRISGRIVLDLVLIAAGIAAFFVFPSGLGFMTRVLIMIIMVLSLDLVLGYAGVATLGHAALFGTGAYGAGLFAVHVSADPLLGLAVGAIRADPDAGKRADAVDVIYCGGAGAAGTRQW